MQAHSVNYPQINKIGFFSPLAGVGKECGYGYAAFELISAWQKLKIPVWAYDREAPVIFNMGQPHFYEDYIPGKLNIGYTPWESTGVPSAWIKYMNKMDEIWVPCQANADWYTEAGVKVPIRVLHHGVNKSHWPNKKRTHTEGPYKFLHVGEPSPRKGGELVYEVFKDTFGDDENVTLTLKGRPRFKLHGKNVRAIPDVLSQGDMTIMHHEHHAMVYPTNGEGFGLIPLQAAATGMPTAVTNWSGPVDYMRFCYPIETRELITPNYEPHVGLWADPDPERIKLIMEDFVNSPNYFFTDAHRKASQIDVQWSWDAIAKTALEWFSDSLNSVSQ